MLVTVVLCWALLKADARHHRSESRDISAMHPRAFRFFSTYFVQTFDSIGLATFTVIGVVVAVDVQVEPLWLWGPILAMLTGAGGGILRDVVRHDTAIATLRGEFYGEVALLWGLVFSIYLLRSDHTLPPTKIFYAVLIILFGAFFTRLGALYLKSMQRSAGGATSLP